MFNMRPVPMCRNLRPGMAVSVEATSSGILYSDPDSWRCSIRGLYAAIWVGNKEYHPLSFGACCVCMYKKAGVPTRDIPKQCTQRLTASIYRGE